MSLNKNISLPPLQNVIPASRDGASATSLALAQVGQGLEQPGVVEDIPVHGRVLDGMSFKTFPIKPFYNILVAVPFCNLAQDLPFPVSTWNHPRNAT